MTVCIAALVKTLDDEPVVVTVSDMMFVGEGRSVESGSPKFEVVGPDYTWILMYSGDEFTPFGDLTAEISRDIAATKCDAPDVKAACQRAFRTLVKRRIEQRILGPLGLTLPQFLKAGARTYGEAFFREMVTEMRAIELDGATLLVVGFDSQRKAHLFSSDLGTQLHHAGLIDHGAVGFHAIGEGAWAALGWLHANDDFRFHDSIAHVAYRLCEAKFAAENARSVGQKNTVVVAQYANGKVGVALLTDGNDPVRVAWRAARNVQPPEAALESLDVPLREKAKTIQRGSATQPNADLPRTERPEE